MSDPERPADSPKANQPEKPKEPLPVAPGVGELCELALTALVNAPGVFLRLSARPAPRPGSSFLLALACGASFFALNLIRVALSHPAELQAVAPWKIGAVFAAALGVWAALYLLVTSFVYGLGRALGAAGDFDRALLVAALVLATAPLQALCSWFPAAWVLPAVLAAWIMACGLSSQFTADAWAARGVCAVLAAGALALQYGAGLLVEKYAETARLASAAASAAPSADQLVDLQKQLQQVQALAVEANPDPAQRGSAQGDSAKLNRSSLDLLSGPADAPQGDSPRPLTERQQLAQMSASGDAMNASVIGMLDSIGPMLNNPAITQGMTPPQKADYAELQKMIAELKAGMAAKTITTPAQQQAQMMKIQGLVMRMMSAGITMPQVTPAPGKKK